MQICTTLVSRFCISKPSFSGSIVSSHGFIRESNAYIGVEKSVSSYDDFTIEMKSGVNKGLVPKFAKYSSKLFGILQIIA